MQYQSSKWIQTINIINQLKSLQYTAYVGIDNFQRNIPTQIIYIFFPLHNLFKQENCG